MEVGIYVIVVVVALIFFRSFNSKINFLSEEIKKTHTELTQDFKNKSGN